MKKSEMRAVVPSVLTERGFQNIRMASSKGLLPGARLAAIIDGREYDIAVKASVERTISFTKQSAKRWRTLSAVDLVVAIVPALNSRDDFEVLAFDKRRLVAVFEKAWAALRKAGRSLNFEIPIFVPLDEVSRKNVGHGVGNVKQLADWCVPLTAAEARARTTTEPVDSFYDRVRREFAERNGVDVSQVEVEFRIKP
jgi:hypothetical protein